jgi:hypothetical protein
MKDSLDRVQEIAGAAPGGLEFRCVRTYNYVCVCVCVFCRLDGWLIEVRDCQALFSWARCLFGLVDGPMSPPPQFFRRIE